MLLRLAVFLPGNVYLQAGKPFLCGPRPSAVIVLPCLPFVLAARSVAWLCRGEGCGVTCGRLRRRRRRCFWRSNGSGSSSRDGFLMAERI